MRESGDRFNAHSHTGFGGGGNGVIRAGSFANAVWISISFCASAGRFWRF